MLAKPDKVEKSDILSSVGRSLRSVCRLGIEDAARKKAAKAAIRIAFFILSIDIQLFPDRLEVMFARPYFMDGETL
jgi:hypothetical protein